MDDDKNNYKIYVYTWIVEDRLLNTIRYNCPGRIGLVAVATVTTIVTKVEVTRQTSVPC